MGFFSGKNVLVTGGTGFVGSHLCEALLNQGAQVTATQSTRKESKNFLEAQKQLEIVPVDLRKPQSVLELVKNQQLIFHCAAVVGGIEFNINHPASIFHDNMHMTLNILNACKTHPPEKLLLVSSACVYPRHCGIPTPESEGFKDRPEPTNEGYGWAKRMQEYLALAYTQEHGLNICVARPYNAYGPRDNFSPKESHVIPGLIHRVLQGENPLKVWGDGNQSRSFLFISDFIKGLLLLMEKRSNPEAVNLGANEEIKIRDLAEQIVKISKLDIKLVFDSSKPTGQPRRRCDTRLAEQELGFQAETSIEQGLQQTMDWYRKQIKK